MKQDDIIREIDRLSKKLALNNAYGPLSVAQSIVGVQPMNGPVGQLFTIKFNYTPETKYKFSRANWYVADFKWDDYDEVHAWCEQQFGPAPPIARQDAWTRWMHKYGDQIHFRDKEDYVWFVLKWGT